MNLVIRLLPCLLTLGCWLSFAPAARAQQNLFNVPSGLSTLPQHVFVQQQLNLSRPLGTSCTTVEVGVSREFELGVNVVNVPLYGRPDDELAAPVHPGYLVNAQRGFSFGSHDQARLSLGTQLGGTQVGHTERAPLAFTWAMGSLVLPQRGTRLFAGGYHANRALAGDGFPLGGLLGLELPLLPERLLFQVDYISGDRDISVAVAGFVIELPAGMQLSLGVQLPAPRSHNPFGLVIELTQRGFPIGRMTTSGVEHASLSHTRDRL